MSAAIWLPVAIVVAASMEPWAALLHGLVWHRALYGIHRSHHRRRRGLFEANDVLSALHAPIAVALIVGACRASPSTWRDVAFGAGVGMTLFGVAYAIVHDGLVHGRLPVSALGRLRFFARVRDAHLEHHRRHGAPYGLFLGPMELARRASQGPPPRGARPIAAPRRARSSGARRRTPPAERSRSDAGT